MPILSRQLRRRANVLLRPLNLKLHDDPADGTGFSLGAMRGRYSRRTMLPAGARDVLQRQNSVLESFRQRYAATGDDRYSLAVWGTADRLSDLTMPYFRGDNAYLWQLRNLRGRYAAKYRCYAGYVRSIDRHNLLDLLEEDGAFGCWTYPDSTGKTVSRDLLDSVNEIYFLDRAWDLMARERFSVVDIGAGYGRLAHRMAAAVPGLERYFCVDAVPESTFLCAYYLAHRGVAGKAVTVPFDVVDSTVGDECDLALSIHSLSEMPLVAIRGWLAWLGSRGVPHLLVVSNEADNLLSLEADFRRLDALPVLAQHGYRLVAAEPVIADPVVRGRLGITDHFLFFAR